MSATLDLSECVTCTHPLAQHHVETFTNRITGTSVPGRVCESQRCFCWEAQP